MTRKDTGLNFNEVIGQRIRKRRKANKMTQEGLGNEVDLSQQQISDIETGKMPINVEDLVRIADVIDSTPDGILLDYAERKDIVHLLKGSNEEEYDALEKIIEFSLGLIREFEKTNKK